MKKILLIEDDAAILEMYRDKFTFAKFDVQTATEGQEGIEKMRKFLPDIVLLDLIMPKMTGFEVLEIIKNDPILNKIPILVLTNIYADAEDLIKNWGVKDFLLKSNCTPEDVEQKVQSILAPTSP